MKLFKAIYKWIKFIFSNNPIVFAEYKDGIMTIKHKDGTEKKYKGNSTVWHELPMMTRQGATKEYQLCELLQYIKQWGGAYPTAHKTKNPTIHIKA